MTDCHPLRFRLRWDGVGFTVYDFWTGLAVVIADVQQIELKLGDAEELADMLELRNARGDRRIHA